MFDWTNTAPAANPSKAESIADTTGLLIGSQIATAFGWRAVDALAPGDLVLTFDHGFRAISSVRRVVLWDGIGTCPRALCPIDVEPGVLPDTGRVTVMPDQSVMVESDVAENYRGDPFAVLSPRAIEGYGLAHPQTPRHPIEVVVLEFAEDEVVYGDNGVLFHISKGYDLLAGDQPNSSYKVLDDAETRDILSELYEAYLDA